MLSKVYLWLDTGNPSGLVGRGSKNVNDDATERTGCRTS